MSRNRLYVLLSAACLAGYTWILFAFFFAGDGKVPGVCLFKTVTSLPCPSCGTTRAVLSVIHGDIPASLMVNPLGIIIVFVLLLVPIWLLFDTVNHKSSLLRGYELLEYFLRQKWPAIIALVLVLLNWGWNIWKGL